MDQRHYSALICLQCASDSNTSITTSINRPRPPFSTQINGYTTVSGSGIIMTMGDSKTPLLIASAYTIAPFLKTNSVRKNNLKLYED